MPPGRDVLERLDDPQALGSQGLDDVFVVDDLPEHIIGPAGAIGQKPVRELERLADPETITQGFGQDDLHESDPDAWHFMRKLQALSTNGKWGRFYF